MCGRALSSGAGRSRGQSPPKPVRTPQRTHMLRPTVPSYPQGVHFPPVSRVTSAGLACHFRRFRGGSGFIPYPVRPVNGVRVRDTVKVEESFGGPPWLSIMIGSVLTGPGASIQPTISGA